MVCLHVICELLIYVSLEYLANAHRSAALESYCDLLSEVIPCAGLKKPAAGEIDGFTDSIRVRTQKMTLLRSRIAYMAVSR